VIEIQRSLGLAGYYERFINGFSKKTMPLTQLTQKGQVFMWTEKCENSFQELNLRLIVFPVLPLPDPIGHFVIFCFKNGIMMFSYTRSKGIGICF